MRTGKTTAAARRRQGQETPRLRTGSPTTMAARDPRETGMPPRKRTQFDVVGDHATLVEDLVIESRGIHRGPQASCAWGTSRARCGSRSWALLASNQAARSNTWVPPRKERRSRKKRGRYAYRTFHFLIGLFRDRLTRLFCVFVLAMTVGSGRTQVDGAKPVRMHGLNSSSLQRPATCRPGVPPDRHASCFMATRNRPASSTTVKCKPGTAT